MVDQCTSRGLLQFNTSFLQKICLNTRNDSDPNWIKNKDPFYSSFMPTILWSLLGSRLRTPGREPVPEGANIQPGSKTNEIVHFSVRQKMEENAKPGAKPPLPPPSKSLEGYIYDSKLKAWVWVKDKTSSAVLNEYTLPSTPDSLEAWLSSDWLKAQNSN